MSKTFFCYLLSLFVITSSAFSAIKVSNEIENQIINEHYTAAEQLLLRTDPSNVNVLAWLKYKEGNKREALALFRSVVSSDSTPVESVMDAANFLLDLGEIKEAASLVADYMARTKSNDPELRLFLADIQLRLGDVRSASTLVDTLIGNKYESKRLNDTLFKIIIYYYQNRDRDKALTLYDKLHEIDPQTRLDPGHLMQFANITIDAGKPLDGLAKIDQIQSDFPEYYQQNIALIVFGKTRAYAGLKDYAQAEIEFKQLEQLDKAGDKSAKIYFPIAKGIMENMRFFRPREALPAARSPAKVFRWGILVGLLVSALIPPVIVGIYLHRGKKTS